VRVLSDADDSRLLGGVPTLKNHQIGAAGHKCGHDQQAAPTVGQFSYSEHGKGPPSLLLVRLLGHAAFADSLSSRSTLHASLASPAATAGVVASHVGQAVPADNG
jgi:hypothetical protein